MGLPVREPLGPTPDAWPRTRPAAPAAEAFEVFFHRDYKAVVALAYALSGRHWAAEDLAQDAFFAAYQRWGTVASYDSPGAYVRHVVANMAVSHRRRLTVEAQGLARLAGRARPAVEPLDPPDAEFWRAVRALPRRQAQSVALYYLDDRSAADIAAILHCSEATVRVHLHRGRLALVKRLGIREAGE